MADRRGLVLGVVAVAVGLDRRDREAVLRVRPDQVLGAEVGRVRRLRAVAKGHDDLRRALVVRLVRRPDQILDEADLALGVLLPEALPQQPRARRVRLVHVLVRLVRLADWIRDVLAGDDARPRPGVVEGDGEAQLLEQRVARLREGRLVLAVLSLQRVVALLRLLELIARHVARRSPINIVDGLAGLGVPVRAAGGGAAHFCVGALSWAALFDARRWRAFARREPRGLQRAACDAHAATASSPCRESLERCTGWRWRASVAPPGYVTG